MGPTLRLNLLVLNCRLKRSPASSVAVAICLLCSIRVVFSLAQGPSPSGSVRTVVVLDPAHGGQDAGAKLADQVLEKDMTLALAAKLRAGLAAAGFTVVTTRDADVPNGLTTDQRAEVANRQRALACVVLHATGAGSGVHVYASTLQPAAPVDYDPEVKPPFQPVPWDEAQADSVRQSLRVQDYMSTALGRAKVPVLRGRASVPPLDNLTCPAVAIEIAPLGAPGEGRTAVSDGEYQQRVVDGVVAAMKSWRDDPASHPALPAPVVRQSAAAAGASQ